MPSLARGRAREFGLVCREVDGDESVVYEVHPSLPRVTDLRAAENTLPLADLLAKGPTVSAGCSNGSVP